MNVIINGYDISPWIQNTVGISETLEKRYGDNQGIAKNGETIVDLVATKLHPTFLTKPISREKVAILTGLMKNATVLLTYDSLEGDARTITAIPAGMTINYATDYFGKRIYNGFEIAFEEKYES